MLDLILLGSGGTVPIPGRYLSSMIINYKGRKILIDAGEGTQVAMREFHTGFRSLDIICISHFHGDHIFGLPGLLATLSNSKRTKPITIIGPSGLKRVIESLLFTITYLKFSINLIEDPKGDLEFTIDKEILRLKEDDEKADLNISIATLKLKHSAPCLGYSFYVPRSPKFHPEKAIENNIPRNLWSKLQEGKVIEENGITYRPDMVLGEERKGIKLSFITDTRPIEEINNFIEDSDLLVCEGTYGDNEEAEKALTNTHMTFKEAAQLAKDANVKKLVLTHFNAGLEDPESYKSNAIEIFKNTVIGFDGYRTTVSYED